MLIKWRDNVYKMRIWLVICSRKDFNDWYEETFEESDAVGPAVCGQTFFGRSRAEPTVIWLRKFTSSRDDLDTLVHECSHATFWILRYVSIPITYAKEEAFTYYNGALVSYFVSAIKRRKR